MEGENSLRIKYSVGDAEPDYFKVESSKEGVRMMRVFANRDRIPLEDVSKFLELQVFVDDHWEVWEDSEGNKAANLVKNI